MNEQIQDRLQEIYLFDIEIEWLSFRQYKVLGFLAGKTIKIIYTYDAKLTLEANLGILIQMIDREILKVYKKGI
jgi:hypothetical protein